MESSVTGAPASRPICPAAARADDEGEERQELKVGPVRLSVLVRSADEQKKQAEEQGQPKEEKAVDVDQAGPGQLDGRCQAADCLVLAEHDHLQV